jgi:uncharacterized caspase-like protein
VKSGSALIVANGEYHDPKLQQLRSPGWDAEALGRVLSDPNIGDFEVEFASDEPEHVLRRKLSRFFADRRRNDLLLLHMSCHGLKDDDGHLYFATIDTEFAYLDSTAVSAEFVRRQMSRSRSGRIVLLLDCCYSGAFSVGMTPRGGTGVEINERFAERGRAVISASNAMEYSFEGDQRSGKGEPAVFTSAVVKALETGQADRDGDGWISVDELYDYVFDEVSDHSPQRPVKSLNLEGDLRIAKSVYVPPVQPARLSEELVRAIENPLSQVRLGAVQVLGTLLTSSDSAVTKAAEEALKRLQSDDSRRVSTAATTFMNAAEDTGRRSKNDDGRPVSVPAKDPLAPGLLEQSSSAEVLREVARLSHADEVLDVVFSPDGKRIATASGDGSARVWSGGEEFARVRHKQQVLGVSISPDGTRIATASAGMTAVVWEIESRRQVVRVAHEQAALGVRDVTFLDARRIATAGGGDRTARIWDIDSGRELGRVTHGGWVSSVACSPDGMRMATASGDRSARIWDIESGDELGRAMHDGEVLNVAFSPDGACIATASGDKTARVRSVEGELVRMRHEDAVLGVAFSPDGTRIATASGDRTARIWEAESGRELARVTHQEWVRRVAFSPDGTRIATASGDKTARVWT